MTLGVLGGDNFVVDLETDVDNNKVEEEIQIETHDCPPCLCLLDHDRDNYFIDSPQQEQENVVTTTTTTTSTTTTTTSTTTILPPPPPSSHIFLILGLLILLILLIIGFGVRQFKIASL